MSCIRLEGSAQKIDFLKRHDLTACDIPTCRAHSGDHNAPWYTVRVILFEELHACNVLNFFRARSRAWCPKLGELCRGVAPAEHRLLVPVGSEGGNSEGGSGEGDGGKGVGGEGGGCEDGGGGCSS